MKKVRVVYSALIMKLILILSCLLWAGCVSKTGCALTVSSKDEGPSYTYSDGAYAYFIFTPEQNKAVSDFYAEGFNASLKLTILPSSALSSEGHNILYTGFLYKEDFTSSKHVSKTLSERPLVSADLSNFGDRTLSLAFSFSSEKEVPLGFFIKSSVKYIC